MGRDRWGWTEKLDRQIDRMVEHLQERADAGDEREAVRTQEEIEELEARRSDELGGEGEPTSDC